MDKAKRDLMVKKAAAWQRDRNVSFESGAFIFWRNKVCGWTRELTNETASTHRPGCIALDTNGNFFKSVGGDEQGGAEKWELVYGQPAAEVVELRESAPTSIDQALQAVEDMPDTDAIASLDPIADADMMQSALVLVAGNQPAAAEMIKVLAARGRQRCREWEIVLDGMSPLSGPDDLLTLFITGPSKAPSMSWLGGYIKRMQVAA